jgi:hypothetical protein
MRDKKPHMDEKSHNCDKKVYVVAFPDTIIKPNTVMVKRLYTS